MRHLERDHVTILLGDFSSMRLGRFKDLSRPNERSEKQTHGVPNAYFDAAGSELDW